jgi:hypothetical protein
MDVCRYKRGKADHDKSDGEIGGQSEEDGVAREDRAALDDPCRPDALERVHTATRRVADECVVQPAPAEERRDAEGGPARIDDLANEVGGHVRDRVLKQLHIRVLVPEKGIGARN